MCKLRTALPWSVALMMVLGGCASANDGEGVQVAIAHLQEADSEVGGALVVRDAVGQSRELAQDEVVLTAEVQNAKGAWEPVDVRLYDGAPRIHTVIVADNSGSQEKTFQQSQEADRVFGKMLLDQGTKDLDKVGVVRVSTESRVLTELTNDPEEYNAAVDAMFVSNGWTSLYDGIRMANEVLDRGALSVGNSEKDWRCVDRAFNSIVVFTDGRDNNSSDMQKTSYEGDGIDTRLEDLFNLQVLGVRTPVYAVGIGRGVDEESLSQLAKETGGFYSPIDSYAKLVDALAQQAKTVGSAAPFCVRLPYCDVKVVRVHVAFKLDGQSYERTLDVNVPEGACGAAPSVGMEPATDPVMETTPPADTTTPPADTTTPPADTTTPPSADPGTSGSGTAGSGNGNSGNGNGNGGGNGSSGGGNGNGNSGNGNGNGGGNGSSGSGNGNGNNGNGNGNGGSNGNGNSGGGKKK